MKHDRACLESVKNWRLNWLDCLYELSDYSLQLHSWNGKLESNNPHWSFVEFTCGYFDDCSLVNGYDGAVNNGFLSKEEAAAVAKFHFAADAYKPPKNKEYDHVAILRDAKWQSVVEIAVAACNALSKILVDPTELAILNRVRGNT